jgi:hypothetical protein
MHAEPGAAPDRGRITGFARHPALAAAPAGELMVWLPPPQRGAAMPQGQRVDLQWPQEGERPCRGPVLVVMWPSRWCRGMGWLARERSGSTSGYPRQQARRLSPTPSLPPRDGRLGTCPLVSTRVVAARPHSAAHRSPVCAALPSEADARRDRCGSELRGGVPPNHARCAGEIGGPTGRVDGPAG